MKQSSVLAFLSIGVFFSSYASAGVVTPGDSVGIERKGNKVLILYKVEPSQTLSSIARQYHTTLTAIKAENPGIDNLQPGQVIRVPYAGTDAAKAAEPANGAPKTPGTHKVAQGESLFGIAKMYNVTLADLRKWNGLPDNSIKIGDELIVSAAAARAVANQPRPVKADTLHREATPTETPAEKTEGRVNPAGSASTAAAPAKSGNSPKKHTVAPGQTLMAISRMYKVSPADLRKWNNLASDNLTVGRELVVQANNTPNATYSTEETGEEAVSPAGKGREADPERHTETQPAEKTETPAPANPVKPATETPKATDKKEKEGNKSLEPTSENLVPTPVNYQKKVEVGLAELIDGTQSSEKYLALHRTAPVGTIVQVKNLMNDLSVFVKVIGKLPDTGSNEKLIVKISEKAYERLAAIDKRFRVEVSYVP